MILRVLLVMATVLALLTRSVLVSEKEPRISQEITQEEVEQQLPRAIDPVFASEPGRVAWGKGISMRSTKKHSCIGRNSKGSMQSGQLFG